MATRQKLECRIAEMVRQLGDELEEVDASVGDCWLDAVENRAAEIGDAISRALIAEQSRRRPATAAESNCPQCGKTGRYVGDRERELISRRGSTTIVEPKYFCPCCRKDFFPSDDCLGS
jgi:hypothetical protein